MKITNKDIEMIKQLMPEVKLVANSYGPVDCGGGCKGGCENNATND